MFAENNGYFEGTEDVKLHSDKKRIHEFLGEISAMIENYYSELIRSIVRNTVMNEFLIRQVELDDILYFTYKMRKI